MFLNFIIWPLGWSKSTPGGSKVRKKAFRIRVREKERQKRDKYGKRRSRTTVFKMILIEGVVFWSVGVGWMGGRRQGAAVPARLDVPVPAHVNNTI